MGTNYYLHRDVCEHCGRGSSDLLHIGKSSAGWAFALRVYPEEGIRDLQDWQDLFREPDAEIRNEYGSQVSTDYMMLTITDRNPDHRRSEIDGRYCIGHGSGTWDLVVGEFS